MNPECHGVMNPELAIKQVFFFLKNASESYAVIYEMPLIRQRKKQNTPTSFAEIITAPALI